MPISESQLVEIIQESLPVIGAMSIRRMQPIQSRMDVDDIMQITAMKAFARRKSLQTDCPEEALHWVRKIGFNEVKQSLTNNHCQKRSVSIALSTSDPVVEGRTLEVPDVKQPNPVDLFDFSDDLAQIDTALSKLSRKQAVAVRLRYFDGAEYEVIAAKLNCTVLAARSIVSRGLAAVRAIVK